MGQVALLNAMMAPIATDCPPHEAYRCAFPPPPLDDDDNNGGFGCAAGIVLQTYGFYTAGVAILAPEPVVTKVYGAISAVTGIVGAGLNAIYCP